MVPRSAALPDFRLSWVLAEAAAWQRQRARAALHLVTDVQPLSLPRALPRASHLSLTQPSTVLQSPPLPRALAPTRATFPVPGQCWQKPQHVLAAPVSVSVPPAHARAGQAPPATHVQVRLPTAISLV